MRFYKVLQSFVSEAVSPDRSGEEAYAVELARLTEAFVAGLPTTALALEAAAQAADAPRLKFLLHTLKGTAGSYGLAHITAMAAAVETQLHAGQAADIAALCAALSASSRSRVGVEAAR